MHIEFYKITSSVIPLFFIALTLQSSFIVRGIKYSKKERRAWTLHADSFLLTTYFMGMGEYISLRNVYYGKSGSSDASLIALALIIPSLIVAVEYILGLAGKTKDTWKFLDIIFWITLIAFIFLFFTDR